MPLTVADLTARYHHWLLPPLPPGPGVCAVCATSVAGPDLHCWQCSRHRELPATADAVTAVSLAVKHGPFAYELGAYKSGPDEDASRRMQRRLAAVLWRWMSAHERCLGSAAGLRAPHHDGPFDVVTVVPSLRGRVGHPLRDMLRRQVVPAIARFRDLLAPAASAYVTTRRLDGRSVLVVDDTWTTGRHAQAAACALKLSGAGPVAVLAFGRHFSADQPAEHGTAARRYLEQAQARGWSWQRCRQC